MKAIVRAWVLAVSLSGVALALIPQVHAADDDPIGKAIKARRGGFQLYSFYAGHLFGMAKGDIEYDAELASTMANNLNTVVNLNNGAMWPADSDNTKRKGKTRAKPNIWAADSKIGEKSKALKTAAADVAAVAGDGLDALKSKIGAVGKSCKGCHDDYRAKEF
ncbi:MAG: cytochrome c [Granulosicoccus sp.]|nr:cytochrome c [Granulosicoccus sp.]